MSARYCEVCGREYCDGQCMELGYPEAQAGPSIDDECAFRGHAYYGDEWNPADAPTFGEFLLAALTSGRCYCGAKRYPIGFAVQERAR